MTFQGHNFPLTLLQLQFHYLMILFWNLKKSNLILIDTLIDDARAATVLLPVVTAAPVSCQ